MKGDFDDKKATEEVNGFRIRIAVVDELSSTVPILGYWKNLKRLG